MFHSVPLNLTVVILYIRNTLLLFVIAILFLLIATLYFTVGLYCSQIMTFSHKCDFV